MPRPPRWTEEERNDLKTVLESRNGHSLDWNAIREKLPDRSKNSIYRQMTDNGWVRGKAWTPEEDRTLRALWGEDGTAALLKKLPHRGATALYNRATFLGLRGGAPQGFVSIKSLSEDPSWGYPYYKTVEIIRAAGLRLHYFNYSSKDVGKKRGIAYVEEDEAIEAASLWEKSWAGKERVLDAAKRLKIRVMTLRTWVTEDGLVPPKAEGKKQHFWALPEVYDDVVARHRNRKVEPDGKEGVPEASARLGVSGNTLVAWLTKAELLPPKIAGTKRAKFRALPEVFDDVAARFRFIGKRT